MAPEQVKKERAIDRRTDVWALGVCLHELVTGKLPYDEDDELEVIRKLMADEAPAARRGRARAGARVLERSLVLDVGGPLPDGGGDAAGARGGAAELGETKTTDDVAAFVRSECPELAQKRKEIVARAIEEARGRGASGRDEALSSPDPDEAFAPTVDERAAAEGRRRRGATGRGSTGRRRRDRRP